MLTVMYVLAYIIAATIGMSVVVGVGTFTLGLVEKRRNRPPAVMSYRESSAAKLNAPPREKTVFDCAVWDQRHFEKKLVEAGIQANVEAMCEDKECPECYPNRPGNSRPPVGIVQSSGINRNKNKSIRAAQHAVEKKRAAEAFAKSRAGKQRTLEVNGRLVPIPNNVPKFASAVMFYDPNILSDVIVWSWTLEGDPYGKPMAWRQNITPEVFNKFPVSGKKKPFVQGGNHLIVCRVCDDTYYVRPGSTGPMDTFTCQRCKHNTPRGNTLPRPPKGKGAGSPAKPKTTVEQMHQILKNQTEQLKREQEFLKREKCKIEELNKQMQMIVGDLNKGTKSTGPR